MQAAIATTQDQSRRRLYHTLMVIEAFNIPLENRSQVEQGQHSPKKQEIEIKRKPEVNSRISFAENGEKP